MQHFCFCWEKRKSHMTVCIPDQSIAVTSITCWFLDIFMISCFSTILMHNISTDTARLYLCILCTLLRYTEFQKKCDSTKFKSFCEEMWLHWVKNGLHSFLKKWKQIYIYVKIEFQGWCCGINFFLFIYFFNVVDWKVRTELWRSHFFWIAVDLAI